ncbi:MAG: carbohydrate ABC transporter permease [Clostridia bacterium]|nr:carbohydrate ABC transporter permease [Clostridia bacterium]
MKNNNKIFQLILNLIFILFCIACVYPFLLLVGISFSNEMDVAKYGYKLIPMTFDLSAYKYIFQNPKSVINAYKVTAIFSVTGTVLSVLLMSMIAYPLSKRNLRGKGKITFYLYFTTLFGGGMVPTYILITQYLHLQDTYWVYILPSLISPWNIFMIRTFFQGLPGEIFESAKIDGASEYQIFAKFVMPLSKPVLATIALLTFLGKWNEWYTSMLYINDDNLISLQYLLQRIMRNIDLIQQSQSDASVGNMMSIYEIPAETVRMAMAVVVAGPALVVFPFFQKYFVKGLTVGSVKG